MDIQLRKPDMVQEASKTGGYGLILEVLIFLAVFLITEVVVAIPMIVCVVVLLLTKPDMVQSFLGSSAAQMAELEAVILGDDTVMLVSLFATAIMIVAVMLFCKLIQKRKMRTLGFKKPGMWKEYGIGMLIGLLQMAVITLICVLTGAATLRLNPAALSLTGLGMLLLLLTGFVIQGMSEEVLCRGYFLVSLARRKGNIWIAVLVNSVAFGGLHLLNPGLTVLSVVNLILFGVFASVYFVKRGSIWGIGAIHAVWNFAQGNLFGFLVSGQGFGTTLFTCETNRNMSVLNGGDFGLEGGVLTTVVLIVCTLLTLKTKQKDVAKEEATNT